MKCAVWVMAMLAFAGGLAGGTMWGQMRGLPEASGPRALPPDRVVATGHGPNGEAKVLTPLERPTWLATAPAATETAPAAGAVRPILRRGPVIIQGGIPLPGGGTASTASLPTIELGDVAEFRTRGGKLWVDVHLPGPSDSRYKPVMMEGFEGPTLVQFTESSGIVNFGMIIRQLEVRAPKLAITLTRTEMHLRMMVGDEGVELTQLMKGAELGEVADDGGAVTLNVWKDGQFSGAPVVTSHAADMRHLRVADAEAFRKYLRPMLTKLGAQRATLPDAEEAVQILGPRLSADGAMETKFAGILTRLDADTQAERDAASRSLDELGWRGALAAQKVDLKKLSVEQRLRVRKFLASYTYMDEKELARSRADTDLLVDCLASEDAALVQAAVAQLEEVTRKKLEVDTALPAEKRMGMLEQWRAAVKEK